MVQKCKQHHSHTTVLVAVSKSRNVDLSSSTTIPNGFPKSLPPGVRCFGHQAIKELPTVIGRGSFGTCYMAKLGPLQVRMKVYRSEPKWIGYFYNKASLLMQLSHENLPFFNGVCVEEGHPKSLLISVMAVL